MHQNKIQGTLFNGAHRLHAPRTVVEVSELTGHLGVEWLQHLFSGLDLLLYLGKPGKPPGNPTRLLAFDGTIH